MNVKSICRWLPVCSLITLSICTKNAQAVNCNSSGSGNWSTSGTWSCGTIPGNGDVIEIGANTTVTISSNISYTGAPMHVKVYGVWRFNGGGAKISMPCGSSVLIGFGGQVIGNSSGNSQTIKICSDTYWSASDGEVPGPAAWPEYVLPVGLTSFTAAGSEGKVDLRWSTASEQGSESFWIHRSRNGNDWDPAGTVAAAGNSTTTINYTFSEVVTDPGLWYYKLLQVDMDGSAHEKGILSVQVEPVRSELICSLRPADGIIGAYWQGHELRSAAIVDLAGTMRKVQLVPIEKDRSSIDLGSLRSNAYVLMLIDAEGERESCKFFMH